MHSGSAHDAASQIALWLKLLVGGRSRGSVLFSRKKEFISGIATEAPKHVCAIRDTGQGLALALTLIWRHVSHLSSLSPILVYLPTALAHFGDLWDT